MTSESETTKKSNKYVVSWRLNDKPHVITYDNYEAASVRMNQLDKNGLKPSLHIKF